MLTATHHPNKTSQSGFNLIELMVVISIVAVLAAIAAPNISSTLNTQRNKQAVENLITTLRQARTKSQLHRQDVTVQTTNNIIRLTVSDSGGTTVIEESTIHPDIRLSAPTPNVVFRANKSVSFSSTGFARYELCNTKSQKTPKDTFTIKVDVNGNISTSQGTGQC